MQSLAQLPDDLSEIGRILLNNPTYLLQAGGLGGGRLSRARFVRLVHGLMVSQHQKEPLSYIKSLSPHTHEQRRKE